MRDRPAQACVRPLILNHALRKPAAFMRRVCQLAACLAVRGTRPSTVKIFRGCCPPLVAAFSYPRLEILRGLDTFFVRISRQFYRPATDTVKNTTRKRYSPHRRGEVRQRSRCRRSRSINQRPKLLIESERLIPCLHNQTADHRLGLCV